jgi:Glycosyl hydrolase family 115/Gylcosyl hydrolase family 115 C-terminal domain
MKRDCYFLLLVVFVSSICSAQTKTFPVVTKNNKLTIVYGNDAPALDSIAAHLLASDIERVTTYRPAVTTNADGASGNIIVIGSVNSGLLQRFANRNSSFFNKLNGQWECYGLMVIDKPLNNVQQALVIAGSDTRGTAYGVFDISEKIGINPWYWWADVAVTHQKELSLKLKDHISTPPSVKYRGIFLNDEDWGLLPWASNTFEPDVRNIGPKTYAKIFELLLRLKANLIWPAMHPGTAPFYTVPGNKKMAELYAIVVGTSHAEPMLRNNVGEWDERTMGRFNYITNKEKVYQYWEDRVKETAGTEAIYTMGMRGVHDSGMEGVKNASEAIPLLEQIIKDQRSLLEKHNGKDATNILQAFTAYKEVLDIYDNGLKIPDDITIIWPDDNYGYIQRLTNKQEQNRSGGTGVYYHASYWGRPHDYLWLSSTNPALMREEMMKAYHSGANRVWVLNVGDIKPLEYVTQLFVDMAWNAEAFKESDVRKHLEDWTARIFGKHGREISLILREYHRLAFERRPEFMGWSQTEPTTKTNYTSYNHFYFNDEAQQRIERYDALEKNVKQLRRKMGAGFDASFYQLVYYPVVCASWMNKKFLYRDKAYVYAKQNRICAYEYAALSKAMYDSIVKETTYYNEQLSGGKWKNIMSMAPRKLPVFDPPVLPFVPIDKSKTWDVVPEGYDTISREKKQLPSFTAGIWRTYFVDIFLCDSVVVEWKAQPSANWIHITTTKGVLLPKQGSSSHRVWVSINWNKLRTQPQTGAVIEVSAGGKKISIGVNALRPALPDFNTYKGFAEDNGLISMYAYHFQRGQEKPGSKWDVVPDLGHDLRSLKASVNTDSLTGPFDEAFIKQYLSYRDYHFYSLSDTKPTLSIYSLPVHPLNNSVGVRYALSIDDGPLQIISFKTVGRSEEWKQNVLRNSAIKEIALQPLKPGRHTLRVYAVDPGVVLDRMVIRFNNKQTSYSAIPETWKN